MASDFGDESGEKLFDWFLRLGQDASEEAIRASAEKLKSALRNLRGSLDGKAPGQDVAVREFARLNLSEFEKLPDYASLREIIDERLIQAAIEHDFAVVGGHDHLVFRVADAPEVDEVFRTLEKDVDAELERACKAREVKLSHARDEEPLEDKARAARTASKAAHEAKNATHKVERFEVKTR
ncbi:hypothetical protein [Adlercreutzia sp. ZJ141]|uniref:hypothetical protein n=1 Tax=Adlercreutzia sp. ZJ141 TaxID=2709406 RepID=UPI0013EBDB48|nr:hypothetical protein [Adlercreutzia sp. ZJ141]